MRPSFVSRRSVKFRNNARRRRLRGNGSRQSSMLNGSDHPRDSAKLTKLKESLRKTRGSRNGSSERRKRKD